MTKPISPLRQRMIDDMTMRNLSANTQETYIRSVAQFSAFHRRSPDKLGVEHVRDFHLHLVSRGLVANSIAVKMAALRFFYGTTLRRPDIAAEIPTPRRPDRLPTVLARAEVERLLKAVGDLKLRTALMTIYSAGDLTFGQFRRVDAARIALAVAADHALVIGAIVGRRLENARTTAQTTTRPVVAFLSALGRCAIDRC